MTKHRFSLGLVALFATMLAQAAPLPALAQGISQKVAVCNPDYTGRCIKPDTNGAVPVTGSLTPSGTQDTNLKQVNGATVNVGAGAAGTGTQRVTTSTDSTIGTVTTVSAVTAITNALPAGSAILGKVGIDQTTPGTTNGVQAQAGENHAGEVGGNQNAVQVPQTVTASSAYTSGNAVGGLMTVANAARVSAGSGLLQSVAINSKSAQTTQIDVFIFSANPTTTTCTDKTAFVLPSADFDKVLGVVHVTDWTAGNVASLGQAQNLAMPYALASGTTIYACAVTRSTPTFTATTDISIGFRFIRN